MRDGMQLRENSRSEVEAEGLQPGAEGTRTNTVGFNGSEALEREAIKKAIRSAYAAPDGKSILDQAADNILSLSQGSSNGSAMREAIDAILKMDAEAEPDLALVRRDHTNGIKSGVRWAANQLRAAVSPESNS